MKQVIVVFLRYTGAHHATGFQALRGFANRLFPDIPVRAVVVDNSLADSPDDGSTDIPVIAGDNSLREFSGWDTGLDHARKNFSPSPDDAVILANDTMHRSYGTHYLDLFLPKEVGKALESGALAGYVDAYPEPVKLMGIEFRSWVRTSLMVTTFGSIQKLAPIGFPFADHAFFSEIPGEFFAPGAPMSTNYRNFLETWLFGEMKNDDGFREKWHGADRLTQANRDFLRLKAKSIFCEHYLSARARRAGIPILDVRRFDIGSDTLLPLPGALALAPR